MAFLTVEELKTHLYGETVQTISRDDNTIPQAAIDAAIAEAGGYLINRYDTVKAFAATGKKRNPLLLIFIKDIAVWHFVNLGNASTDMELRRLRYERAVDWLKSVQKGDVVAGLPARDEDRDGDGIPDRPAGDIIYGSNPKRCQHF